MSAVALGLKPGDEVIVPAFTWISTANIVEHQGGKPIFCDIDISTFNIDISPRVKVISVKESGTKDRASKQVQSAEELFSELTQLGVL